MTTSAPSPSRYLAWLPLAALVVLLAVSALTASSGPAPARAATTIDVTGLVDEYVYLDASGCSDANALAIGDLVPGDPWKRTTDDCTFVFGTSNSALGADLAVLEDPGAPASPAGAMKCQVASCTGGSYDGVIDDVAPDSAPPTSTASAFGVQLEAVGGLATSPWTVGRAHPVDPVAATACSTAAIGDGTCAFRFGAAADVGDGPGAYQTQAQFLVLAR